MLDRAIRGNSDSKRYTGRVAVLMSRYVMSSNEAFVLMMHQAENCKLIGQPSFGSSANPKPHQLPNGVEIVIPSWKALRPDGSCFEGEGIEPDVHVEVGDGDLESRDPILERALEYLRT